MPFPKPDEYLRRRDQLRYAFWSIADGVVTLLTFAEYSPGWSVGASEVTIRKAVARRRAARIAEEAADVQHHR